MCEKRKFGKRTDTQRKLPNDTMLKEKHVCFMDYRTCEVHFCTVKIPKLKENEDDEGSYIERELTEKYGYNSDCYYMSSDKPIKVTIH